MNKKGLINNAIQQITGIKLEREKNGSVNMTQNTIEYKNKSPVEFKKRFRNHEEQ